MGSEEEKRRSLRFGVQDATIVFTRGGLLSFLEKATARNYPLVNISKTGVQFLSKKRLSKFTRLNLSINMPQFQSPLNVKVEVEWVRLMAKDTGQTVYQVGARFVHCPKEVRDKLEWLRNKAK